MHRLPRVCGRRPAHVTPEGYRLDIRRGDASAPLLGVVRLEEDIPEDADWDFAPGGIDLVVLGQRLYAGGPRDAWDIHALLESQEDPKGLSAEVDRQSAALPGPSRALWRRIRGGG